MLTPRISKNEKGVAKNEKGVGVIFAIARRGRVVVIEKQEQKWYIDIPCAGPARAAGAAACRVGRQVQAPDAAAFRMLA